MSLRNETIISFNFRNLFTVAVMVTIGWFVLHLMGASVDAIGNYIWDANASGDAELSSEGGGESVSVQF